jgi:hypothetical protein
MTGLDKVMGTMSGPQRLRSALKQKTRTFQTFITALDGPTELKTRIPVSVFGGDIFGVMSQQLREALLVSPPSAPSTSHPRHKHSLPSALDPLAQHPSNRFPLFVDQLKHSTLSSEPVAEVSSEALSSLPPPQRTTEQATTFSPAPRLSRGQSPNHTIQTPTISRKETNELLSTSSTKNAPVVLTLVTSLKRYWQSMREDRPSNQAPQSTTIATDSPKRAASVPVSNADEPLTPRAWPTLVGRDLSEKLRSFGENAHQLARPPLRTSRVDSDRQIQNIFNIEFNNSNQHSPNYDDLGERIAEILHEQALQHGIDVI